MFKFANKKGRLTTIGLALCSLLSIVMMSAPAIDASAAGNITLTVYEEANGQGWSLSVTGVDACSNTGWWNSNEISSYRWNGTGDYGIYGNANCAKTGSYFVIYKTGTGLENLPSQYNDIADSFGIKSK
ncbi:MAG: hypothetical protein LBC29_02315 [Propionibacteriaceae bacterium]|jgi:hypothetical protein|nr:hypothetical protein [Propionibacteriaceae bacterium]